MILSCPDCGALQAPPTMADYSTMACAVCSSELERTTGRWLDGALACAAATLLLLIPANLLPFLTTSVLGASRQSHLYSSATSMWTLDWPVLSVVIFIFLIVAPFLRFGLLTLVLGLLRLQRRPPWLGRAFRWANGLQTWAMPDVFLLGLWVAYARLSATVTTTVEPGAICFIGAGLLALFTRATLDKAAVWALIAPERSPPEGGAPVTCPACELVMGAEREGETCPRCQARVCARKPHAVATAVALTLAGMILYIPANLYPIATIPIGLKPTSYTVLGGVQDLLAAHLLGLALLVFTASFAIPFFKLAGLTWCVISVLRRSPRRLKAKTTTYRVIEEIGRWSMVDPFVIACFVPVTQFNAAISSSADTAAPFFTGVVVLTIMAAKGFDPRLMWDAARSRA